MGAATNKPDYRKQVEAMLKAYPWVKQTIQESNEELYPSCVPIYEEMFGHGEKEYASSTEKYGIKRAKKYERIKELEDALKTLNFHERMVITETYFKNNDNQTAITISEQLGLAERTYFRIKKEAILKIAGTLELIQ
ncbi:hypothetical protein IC619_015310 [Hazenella sp. IB182353]|uniref:ArpU family phage packaging/lysis transcriptional regulator n=1 Tax=Polycladospora coralii TaxID=2771432 RepID=UPI0017467FCB|nr:ArpU family phage packaging/lysis transcriptional regulator [Polycladospora coralii]MBS7531840.1 hypothetical protein [Polycladospora coralii]